jgi:hypothetical protein
MVEWLSLIHYNNRPDTVYQICQQPGVSCYQFIIVVRVSPISLGSHDRANILRLHDERWSVFSSVLRANLMEQAFSVLMYSRPLITLCTIESVAILRSS